MRRGFCCFRHFPAIAPKRRSCHLWTVRRGIHTGSLHGYRYIWLVPAVGSETRGISGNVEQWNSQMILLQSPLSPPSRTAWWHSHFSFHGEYTCILGARKQEEVGAGSWEGCPFFAMRWSAGIPSVPDALALDKSSIDLLSWFCTKVMYMGR